MRKKKTETTTHQAEEKFLDVSASMQGTLRFDDPVNLRISGKFEGTLETRGKLYIGAKADIKANTMVSIWLNSEATESQIAEFVLIR